MLHFDEDVQVMATAATARLTSKQTGSIPMSSVFLYNVHISLTLCYNVPKICFVLHHLFLSKRQYLHFIYVYLQVLYPSSILNPSKTDILAYGLRLAV